MIRRNSFFATFCIITATAFVSVFGSRLTMPGLSDWYDSLTLPSFTPPGSVIGLAWTIIFLLTAWSAIYAYRHIEASKLHRVMLAYAVNGVLNVLWSFLFFTLHSIPLAFVEMFTLALSIVYLQVLLWHHSRFSAYLLIPYLGWVLFATFLTFEILRLNIL